MVSTNRPMVSTNRPMVSTNRPMVSTNRLPSPLRGFICWWPTVNRGVAPAWTLSSLRDFSCVSIAEMCIKSSLCKGGIKYLCNGHMTAQPFPSFSKGGVRGGLSEMSQPISKGGEGGGRLRLNRSAAKQNVGCPPVEGIPHFSQVLPAKTPSSSFAFAPLGLAASLCEELSGVKGIEDK